jgi:indole-3-glycerol phosphate synthase
MLTPILESADARAREADAHIDGYRRTAQSRGVTRGFIEAIASPGLSVIAEIKRRSPSAGDIDASLDPVVQALAYEAGGADAISILTEPDFFGGSIRDLVAVREAVALSVLRKDFTRNEAQIWEARAAGADAVLLIVATLTQSRLEDLVSVANDVSVDVIVETHSASEIERAVAAGAVIIGVNNRDLSTFTTDLSVAEDLAPLLPAGVVSIGESGVSSVEGAARMRRAGYDAILVGEALVRSPDPAGLVTALKDAR